MTTTTTDYNPQVTLSHSKGIYQTCSFQDWTRCQDCGDDYNMEAANALQTSGEFDCGNGITLRVVAVTPELQARFDFPIVRHNNRLGFWNWNKSAFIVVGDSEAEIWSDLNTPHQPEDSLGLGHFNS